MPIDYRRKTEQYSQAKQQVNEPKPQQFTISSPKYSMDELIVTDELRDELQTVVSAQQCYTQVFEQWNLQSVMKSRRNLFVNLYGAPGTGKTMAAHAIASSLGMKMICVNYADIESKYVGETSKNLTALFDYAAKQNVVIFFDEADALLSKRVTNMSNSTDVSVNQTRSVLLTLLNDYNGIVLFATNFISNYDPAFMRRIQYHIKFTMPNEQLRRKLWRKYIPAEMPTNINIDDIAARYSDISGSDISTAVLKAALRAASNGSVYVQQQYFEDAVNQIKDSKTANSGGNVIVTKREVSEEYAMDQMKKSGVSLEKANTL